MLIKSFECSRQRFVISGIPIVVGAVQAAVEIITLTVGLILTYSYLFLERGTFRKMNQSKE
jgi:hypothetical protein